LARAASAITSCRRACNWEDCWRRYTIFWSNSASFFKSLSFLSAEEGEEGEEGAGGGVEDNVGDGTDAGMVACAGAGEAVVLAGKDAGEDAGEDDAGEGAGEGV